MIKGFSLEPVLCVGYFVSAEYPEALVLHVCLQRSWYREGHLLRHLRLRGERDIYPSHAIVRIMTDLHCQSQS